MATRVRARLRSMGDPARAAGARRYFKSYHGVDFYGIRTAEARALVREVYQEIRNAWRWTDALDFCDRLIRDPHLEAKIVGVELLGRYHRDFDIRLVDRAERWLKAGHCANWATVDDLSPRILAQLLERYPRLITRFRHWTASPHLWVRRAAVVTLIGPARHGRRLDDAYDFATRVLADREDLMHKCTGWLLREAGRMDMRRLERFLLENGPRIPRTTVRYAIERFPVAVRRRLLQATREKRK